MRVRRRPPVNDPLVWTDLVREVGKEFGREVTDDEAGMVLWEYTGFPSFWDGNPVDCCTQQLREHFAGISTAATMFATPDELDDLRPAARLPWAGQWVLRGDQWTRFYQAPSGVRIHFGPTVTR